MLRRRLFVGAVLGTCLVGAGFAGGVTAGGELPQAVNTAVEKFFGKGGGFEQPEARIFDTATCYVATGTHDGRPVMITVSEGGDLQSVATAMAFNDLPKSVQKRLESAYHGAQFESIRSLDLKLYEASVINKTGGEPKLVHIFAAGNRWPETVASPMWRETPEMTGGR